MSIFEILGFLLIPGDLIPSLLRLRHLYKTRSVAGISASTNIQWMVSWWAWAAYAILIDSPPLLIVSLVAALVDTIYLIALNKAGVASWRLISIFSVGGIILVLLGATINAEIIAAVITIVDLIVLLPQVRKSIKEADLSGISISAWIVGLLQDIGWVVYAFGIGHPLLAGWSIVSAPASMVILYYTIKKRNHRKEDTEPVEKD